MATFLPGARQTFGWHKAYPKGHIMRRTGLLIASALVATGFGLAMSAPASAAARSAGDHHHHCYHNNGNYYDNGDYYYNGNYYYHRHHHYYDHGSVVIGLGIGVGFGD
jgi:hypothetical protein